MNNIEPFIIHLNILQTLSAMEGNFTYTINQKGWLGIFLKERTRFHIGIVMLSWSQHLFYWFQADWQITSWDILVFRTNFRADKISRGYSSAPSELRIQRKFWKIGVLGENARTFVRFLSFDCLVTACKNLGDFFYKASNDDWLHDWPYLGAWFHEKET